MEPEEQWPKEPLPISEKTVTENDPEVKRVIIKAVITSSPDLRENTTECVNKLFQHYSSWYLLKRGVAWILKLRKELLRRVNIKRNSLTTPDDTCDKSVISYQNLKEAEKAILVFIQQQEFPMEMNILTSGNSRVPSSSPIRNLDPFLDEGLIRVGGRLDKSNMPVQMKHPVILPKDHHVSVLILRQIHSSLLHSGRNHMLAKLR